MSLLQHTLVSDGSSDASLLHPIRWTLHSLGVRLERGEWADLRHVTPKPSGTPARVEQALELYPCDLLFVHRDAEADGLEARLAEMQPLFDVTKTMVCVVPVRMTEAWLLHDEAAIRRAAGNPNGTAKLDLPPTKRLERLPDPKESLAEALLAASELTGRRRAREKRSFGVRRARVAELIDDYAPLLGLPAFALFARHLDEMLNTMGWPRQTHHDGETR